MYYKLSDKKLFALLLLLWFLVNLLQAIYTEVNPDEAYYFLYGKYLSWGYFDHPPMVGLMVHISSWLFNGNLGIRFTTVVLQIATLILIFLQLDNKKGVGKKSIFSFFIIAASLVMFSIYGFITTPDAPLLFFTSLFLYAYKKFLQKNNWASTFVMAIAMAGLVYSKYQGILVIGFVILSNIRLITNPKIWTAFVLALAICIPHFYWQYINDFPSLQYQLISRSKPFKWNYFFEYLPNQLIAFNPFTLGAIMYILFNYRPIQQFEKAQYFMIGGFILFFWITTFRGHAEPQWTVAASIPMIILLNNKIMMNRKLCNYVQKFITGSLVLILTARVLLAAGLLPEKLELSGKEQRYRAIEKVAQNRPVIFTGSYQNPSLYTFFTGKPASVISSLYTRQTQFDLWHFEQNWIGKPVFINGIFEGKSTSYKIGDVEINGFVTDSFQTTNRLKINFTINKDSIKVGDLISVHFTIENPTQHDINFLNQDFPVEIHAVVTGKAGLFEIKGTMTKNITVLKSNERIKNEMQFVMPDIAKGDYRFGLSCSSLLGPTLNSRFKKITLF